MLSCYDVANYFLTQVSEDAGDLISNLKLQKLVYYAQGFHLALYDEPLFPEALEAWTNGPVVPELFRHYKKYESGAIPCPKGVDFSIYDEETRNFLDEVYSVFGQFAAWKLYNLSLEEAPWKLTAGNGHKKISHKSLKKYFQTQLNYEEEGDDE